MGNKEKCEELRMIRVKVESDLGLKNIVRKTPCTFEGECSGTCLACEAEEKALMNEIYKLSKKGELRRELVPLIPVPSFPQKPISTTMQDGIEVIEPKKPSFYHTSGMILPPKEIFQSDTDDDAVNKLDDKSTDNLKGEDIEKKGLFGRIFGRGKK